VIKLGLRRRDQRALQVGLSLHDLELGFSPHLIELLLIVALRVYIAVFTTTGLFA
jgi:hypothetical protein